MSGARGGGKLTRSKFWEEVNTGKGLFKEAMKFM